MAHPKPISVVQYGLGAIGTEIARLMLTKPWIRLVGAVDIDPAKAGRDLGDVIGTGQATGIKVTPAVEVKADVVVHSTGSSLRQVHDQLIALLAAGSHVVSTCEELSFPLDSVMREELTRVARSKNVSLLGTGVSPGFVMDKLPLTLTAVCQSISEIEVFRVIDASQRREPLQRKVGAGLSREAFNQQMRAGQLKMMGLRESLMLIANGLNVDLDVVDDERILPVMAEQRILTSHMQVEPGHVAGVHQRIRGEKKGVLRISLDIKAYVGASDPHDEVVVRGMPDLRMRVEGIHGDRATAAMAVNAIPRVVVARPGVLTMDDIPISYH